MEEVDKHRCGFVDNVEVEFEEKGDDDNSSHLGDYVKNVEVDEHMWMVEILASFPDRVEQCHAVGNFEGVDFVRIHKKFVPEEAFWVQ